MNLNSNNLLAFYQVAKTGSFSKAARILFVTQSAISQRISSLEKELETTILIREKNAISLTEAGEKLLQYTKSLYHLEDEFLGDFKSNDQLKGTIRICAFSSVLRSIIIPKLSPYLRKNPHIKIEFLADEMSAIPFYLKSAKADLIILDYHLNKQSIEEKIIGQEEYVVIESIKYPCPKDIYLDQGPEDNATESFFLFQKDANFKYRRSFMGDVYGIIDGVKQGLGRAVMSKHLVDKSVKIINGFKPYKRDITLHYNKAVYYSKIHQEIVNILTTD